MHPLPDVSVVISTYNRCGLLPAALEGLAAQDLGGVACEYIVVDNNSTDDTRQVVESHAARLGANLRYVFEGRQGLSHGRNAGIRAARAPIVAFTDDDICVAPDWVARVKGAFDAHPEAAFVGGKVLPRWPAPPPAWLTRDHWSPLAIVDYGDAPFVVSADKPRCLVGANLAFRRDALELAGMFSPQLQRVKDGIGSMEDMDMEERLWQLGRVGMYTPELIVHAPVQADRLTRRYHRRWHRGHGRFNALKRDPQLERSRIRLFDVPGHIYRQAVGDAVGWCVRSASGAPGRAFVHETNLCFFAGFFARRFRDYLASWRVRRGAATQASAQV